MNWDFDIDIKLQHALPCETKKSRLDCRMKISTTLSNWLWVIPSVIVNKFDDIPYALIDDYNNSNISNECKLQFLQKIKNRNNKSI